LGFAEKSRLTADYLSYSFSFYRRASESCAEALAACVQRGYKRLGLYGFSDLAEIAALRALERPIELVCLLDPARSGKPFLNLPVIHELSDAPHLDAWLFTELNDAADHLQRLRRRVNDEQVLVPSILGLKPDA
jgi:hypothetical protein